LRGHKGPGEGGRLVERDIRIVHHRSALLIKSYISATTEGARVTRDVTDVVAGERERERKESVGYGETMPNGGIVAHTYPSMQRHKLNRSSWIRQRALVFRQESTEAASNLVAVARPFTRR